MRKARTPQEGCGRSRGQAGRHLAARHAGICARAFLILITAALSMFAVNAPAVAQDPSIKNKSGPVSSFPKTPGGMFGKVNKSLDGSKPLDLQGDQLIYDTAGNRVIARGNVEIFYNDNILTADEVIYDQGASTLTAIGNVVLKEPQGNIVRADRYTLTDDFRDGFVESLNVLSKDQTRISAARATRRDGNVTEFQDGKFTPCKSDGSKPPLWCLSAARITHDAAAQTITYKDAFFEVFGQPVFYLPYFQHPDPTVKRRSGFLMPGYGQSSNLGFMTEVPYYFALADNYDFTFRPSYLSDQGILWSGEWRHRLANGEYKVKIAGIDQDADNLSSSDPNRDDLDGWRGTVETRGLFSLSSWWKFGWDVTLESDDAFRRYYKLDNILLTDRVNQVFMVGQSDRNYFGARLYHFGGLLLDDTPIAESRAHPIIDYNYVFADPVLGGELKWDTNVLSFSRDDGVKQRFDQNINRIVTEVKWRRRFTDQVGITYTPFANLRGDIYQFDNFADAESFVEDANGNLVIDPATGLPISSTVDNDTTVRGIAAGGATVAYPWVANTNDATHIIEPIGQIVSRQESVTQRRLPDEDARSLIFDDSNLFEVSKFSGYDRTEMGTRANAGLQYTFQLNTGGYARVLAGQSFHLDGDNVYRNPGRDDDGNFVHTGESGLQSTRSDYVLGAYIAPTDFFRLISQSRFDEQSLELRREDAGVELTLGPLGVFASYAYSGATTLSGVQTTQQDFNGLMSIQLTNAWSIAAGARYDIDEQRFLSDFMQVRYSDECFVLTATYTESYYDSVYYEDDRSIMLRFEFKHIGEFNYKTDTLDFAYGGDQRTNN
ncbi:MAG: LPS-assembly protein LptD [Hyphomicrobium sp.]